MKIDFAASFPEVIRRVDRPVSADPRKVQSNEFQTLLSSISPDKAALSVQPSEIPTVSPAVLETPIVAPAQEFSPMARFDFPKPEPLQPLLSPIGSEATGDSIANETPEGVKTPTVVDAKRIPAEDPFKGLSRDERIAEVKKLVSALGNQHGIDPALSLAVASRESGFNPLAISSDGFKSKGLFQLLDSTAKDLIGKLGVKKEYSPFNPTQNAELGISHLRYLHDLFAAPSALNNGMTTVAAANSSSLEKLALAAFNAGEGRVASAQARTKEGGGNPSQYDSVESYLPESTQKYVRDVFSLKSQFSAQEEGLESDLS